MSDIPHHKPVAIVGIGCRFPGADGPESFWRLLADGIDAVREVPPERWSVDELHDDDPAAPGKMTTRWGGFLRNVDLFDAGFFGISPREAAHIDPQQRLLMEVAWEALEDAGLPAERLRGQAVGVFVGMSSYDYGSRQLTRFSDIRDGYVNTGSALSIGANRLSYLFDFRGPSVVFDTACSSSLVAARYACESVRRGESRVALAGGVNLILSPAVTIGFSKLQAMAPDGRCKSFDARANGYVRGEGAGIVVLKPLADAIADGDRIYAVIRGGAINQDGRTNGLTAPNGLSQEALVREALVDAEVPPAAIQYVEAHGTGTALGDPIELNALGTVLAAGRPRESRCAVGSSKTNFGHLEAAAGVAGLIKLALSLERRQLPPSLHFEKPNPYIRFDILPLRVVTRLEPWPADDGVPARAGVSSFGFGGTNAHLVLEEPPVRVDRDHANENKACLLAITARSEDALSSLVRRYAGMLTAEPADGSLVDLCATAALRRSHHDFRVAAVAVNRTEMANTLSAFLDGERPRGLDAGRRLPGRGRKVAFVFPGQGSQWLGMGRELTSREPVFAEAIERCDAAFAEHVEWSLTEQLHSAVDTSRLDEVDVVQPALFAIEVAIAELWQSWGIKPDAVVGHSMGEIAAAHIAGALSLSDAARIVCRRSRLARRASGRGAMAAVELSLAQANEILAGYEGRLAVAVSNSPTSTVLSGDTEAMEDVLAGLERDGVFCRRINVDYASHSPHMDVLRDDLRTLLEGVAPRRTAVPLYSTVTGGIAAGPDLGSEYWVRNLREPVLFAAVIEKLLNDGIDVFLEVSPHPILVPAIQQSFHHLAKTGFALGSLRRNEGERQSLLETLASLYATGKSVEWNRIYPAVPAPVTLPAYPWQRERFWVDHDATPTVSVARAKTRNPLIGEHIRSMVGPETHIWQLDVGPQAFPFLKDHRVHGEIVVPSTAYLEMALEAAREALGEEASLSIENVRFEKPLVLGEAGICQLQVILTRQLANRLEWQVFARTRGSSPNQLPGSFRYASGQIAVASFQERQGVEIEWRTATLERCPTEISAAEHYRVMSQFHLDYGPSFQGVESLSIGNGEAFARLSAPAADARRYQMYPPLLDSALQVLGAALSNEIGATLLPASVQRYWLRNEDVTPEALSVHAVWRTDGPRMFGDVRLFTDAGELVAEVSGFGLEPLNRPVEEDSALYAVEWEKQAALDDSDDERKLRVLIFADSTGVGRRLADRISQTGGLPVLVTCDTELHTPRSPFGAEPHRINPARGDDYSRLLTELTRESAGFDSVVHLWSLDIGEDEDDAFVFGLQSTLLLVQALVHSKVEHPPRLWLATRGAQSVVDGEDVSPFQAPLWGLGRTIAQEHPELACTLVDLGSSTSDLDSGVLLNELRHRDKEQQTAYRETHRFVSRLTSVDDIEGRRSTPGRRDDQTVPFCASIATPGDLSSVVYQQVGRRRPGAGDVEIEVAAVGLNFRDVLLGLGLLPAREGVRIGHECAGRITAIGDGVREWSVGDEVVALAKPSLSSFVSTDASLVSAKPRGLDFEEAATLPIAFLTAHYALNRLARLRRNERVLVHSATGAVGLACVRIAQEIGADIYVTAGTDQKRRLLESLGVRRVMDSRSLAFADEVRDATGGDGVDVVVNSLSGEAMARGLAILRPGGRFVELGKRDLLESGQIPLRWLEDSRSFFLVDLSSLAEKRPAFCGELLRESLQFFVDKQLEPLPKQVFPAADLTRALDHMARSQHIGKVVVQMDHRDLSIAPAADPSACVRDDSTYVVTGGLSGLGLAVSRWLFDKGARNLVLVGRSGPAPEALEAIAAIERAGGHVVVDRFDVSDTVAVDAAFARWASRLPPVRGIVHAAGLLDDGILIRQSPERFLSVMAPKVTGAWNLHRASLECDLDFFVLFSSAASILGSAGQSNYAAANQFLDALAHHRRARKLPAVSINWGPWSQVGLAARADRGGRLAVGGMKSVSPRQGLEALGRILLGELAQVCVMTVDWREWRAAHAAMANMPFFSRLDASAAQGPENHPSLLAQLHTAPFDVQIEIVQERLRQHAASVLRLAPARIDIEQPLLMMGIDSLLAVELKSRIERELGVAIPLLQLIKGPSLSELTRTLIAIMTENAVPSRGAIRKDPPVETVTAPSPLLSFMSFRAALHESNRGA